MSSRRLIRRLGRAASISPLLAAGAALVALIAAQLLGGRIIVIRSGSMGATAPVGSVVMARPAPATTAKPGMVAAIEAGASGAPGAPGRPGPLLVHRIISVEHTAAGVLVHTKGDANAAADPEPHLLTHGLFRPVAIIPLLGYVLSSLRTPLGWLVLIVLPGTALFASAIVRIWGTAEAEADDEDAADSDGCEPLCARCRSPLAAGAVADAVAEPVTVERPPSLALEPLAAAARRFGLDDRGLRALRALSLGAQVYEPTDEGVRVTQRVGASRTLVVRRARVQEGGAEWAVEPRDRPARPARDRYAGATRP